jgi:hypothetical protein
MTMLRTLLPFFAAVAFQAAAAIPQPVVGGLSLDGEGCSGASGELAQDASGQWTYTLVFPSLGAFTTAADAMAFSSCSAEVDVTPPVGYRMSIGKLIVEGTHMTPQGATTRVDGNYELDGNGAMPMSFAVEPRRGVSLDMPDMMQVVHQDGIGSPAGNWGVEIVERMTMWTECNADGSMAPATLRGLLNLSAQRDGAGRQAEIAVQRSDVGMMWAWRFERCAGGDAFAGDWRSTYIAPNGRQVSAFISVRGSEGTYRTSSWTGQLSQIRVDRGTVRGRWWAQGQGGWFAFRLDGGTRFDGEWGFGHEGTTAQGRWWGERGAR